MTQKQTRWLLFIVMAVITWAAFWVFSMFLPEEGSTPHATTTTDVLRSASANPTTPPEHYEIVAPPRPAQAAASRGGERTRSITPNTTQPVHSAGPQGPIPGSIWEALGQCESGNNPQKNTGNGFYGAFQFLPSTWRSLGERGLPHQVSYATQLAAAKRLQARSGWGQWPACARRLGLS